MELFINIPQCKNYITEGCLFLKVLDIKFRKIWSRENFLNHCLYYLENIAIIFSASTSQSILRHDFLNVQWSSVEEALS